MKYEKWNKPQAIIIKFVFIRWLVGWWFCVWLFFNVHLLLLLLFIYYCVRIIIVFTILSWLLCCSRPKRQQNNYETQPFPTQQHTRASMFFCIHSILSCLSSPRPLSHRTYITSFAKSFFWIMSQSEKKTNNGNAPVVISPSIIIIVGQAYRTMLVECNAKSLLWFHSFLPRKNQRNREKQ